MSKIPLESTVRVTIEVEGVLMGRVIRGKTRLVVRPKIGDDFYVTQCGDIELPEDCVELVSLPNREYAS